MIDKNTIKAFIADNSGKLEVSMYEKSVFSKWSTEVIKLQKIVFVFSCQDAFNIIQMNVHCYAIPPFWQSWCEL